MKSSVSNYESNFYLSGVKILGVSDVNFGYSVPIEHLNVIGNNKFATFTSGPPQGSLSIQKYLCQNDHILNYTGAIQASGGLFYNNKNFTFRSAYLNSFNVSCAVGNFPQLSADFIIFGNVGTGLGFTTSSQSSPLTVVRPGDISVQCDGSITNRVEAFTYSVECGRIPFYHPTGSGAIDVRTVRPYKVNAQFTIGVDDFESKRAFDYVIDSNKRNINITIVSVAAFTINNMELIAESINSSATDELSMTLNYQGFI
jgi:hypothetical protein